MVYKLYLYFRLQELARPVPNILLQLAMAVVNIFHNQSWALGVATYGRLLGLQLVGKLLGEFGST